MRYIYIMVILLLQNITVLADEIIAKVTKATNELEVQLSSVVNDEEENISNLAPVEVVEEGIEVTAHEVVIVEDTVLLESNSTNVETLIMLESAIFFFKYRKIRSRINKN